MYRNVYDTKGRAATEDKNNFIYAIDCNNCKVVCFGESKWSLKLRSDEHKRSIRSFNCDENKIAKHCWEVDHNETYANSSLLRP